MAKRRAFAPFYGRMGGRDRRGRDNDSGDEMLRKPTVQSSVVAYPKEQKTRKDCIDEQKTDAKGMARNRRMFGLLLGTLQKFRVESQQTQDKEQKRMEIEKKLEEIAEKEKEDLRKERIELFQERKRRQAELRRLEFKVELVKQHEEWEQHYDHLKNFIRTKTKPHLYYLPREASAVSEKRLADTRQEIDAFIAEKRQRVEEDVTMMGKRRPELAVAAFEASNVVVAIEGSLAVATKRKRQGNDTKNGADDDDDSSSSSSSDSESSSSSQSDDVAAADRAVDESQEKMEIGSAVEAENRPPKQDNEKEEGEASDAEAGNRGPQVAAASPARPQVVDEIAGPTAENNPKPTDADGPITIKVEPDEAGAADAETAETAELPDSAEAAAAAKTEGDEIAAIAESDELVAIAELDIKQDILDQSNLTEKEFEPIYD